MGTSVHIPKPLLKALDQRAHALQISRNRLILKALTRELAADAEWSPGFFDKLSAVDDQTAGAIDDMVDSIRRERRSKNPRRL